MNILLIALGGATGSIFRFLLSSGTYNLLGRHFPYGTMLVNIIGCILVGIISVILFERTFHMESDLRNLLIIGFLGGFTTFSSFSLETINLIENGQITFGILNVLLSVSCCLIGTWMGMLIGKEL